MSRFHGSMLAGALGLAVGGLGGAVAAETATDVLMQAAEEMEEAMRRPMTGDPDTDFARMMLAHHEGAIKMAEFELRYGTDPELRALAAAIVEAQTVEVRQLDAWLERQPR